MINESVYARMAQRILASTGYISWLHWNMQQNVITLKSFRIRGLKRDRNDMKLEFLDDHRKKCQLHLSSFNELCDLRDGIMQITSILKSDKKHIEHQQKPIEQPTNSITLLETILKMEYAKALIINFLLFKIVSVWDVNVDIHISVSNYQQSKKYICGLTIYWHW